jgi:hypothetical protein
MSVSLQSAPSGPGASLGIATAGSDGFLFKSFGGNYARSTGVVTFQANLAGTFGFGLTDTGTTQVSIGITGSTGNVVVKRGTLSTGVTVATSTQSVVDGSVHTLAWDVTIHNSAGIAIIWLDGVATSINLTGQNTRSSSNNFLNGFNFQVVNFNNSSKITKYDHLAAQLYIASGGSELPPLANPVIETQFAISDSAVQFAGSAGVLGQDYSTTANTNAPGANELFLRQFTPLVNCTINSVSILPAATSATAKFKAVIYSGSPTGAALSSGTEVVGCTSGTVLTGALVTPQSLTAGTPYWIGFITDTSVVLSEVDTTTTGAKAANTYASGAPSSPTMTTGQASWIIFGNCTVPAANWAQVAANFGNPPLGDLSYNQDSTVGHEDLFNFPPLSTGSQTIYTAAVKMYCARSDAGARTVDMRTKSSSTDSGGSSTGQAPGTTYGWLASYFDVDPNGSVAWTKTALDAATSGYKIAS